MSSKVDLTHNALHDDMFQNDWPHNALRLCHLPILQQYISGDCDLRITSDILREQVCIHSGCMILPVLVSHLCFVSTSDVTF